jgi:hypothetical protein
MTKTKTKIGLLDLTAVPITAEPAGAMPTYAAADKELSLGHAVRAALTVEMDQLRVHGDDALQIAADLFNSGALDTEALLDDLALEAALYGSTADGTAVTDNGDDSAPPVGVYYVQKLMKKDRSIVYRAVVLFRCTANRANYSDEANTRTQNLEPKNHPVGFIVYLANNNDWRWRDDFETEAAALAAIAAKLHPAAPGP